MLPLKDYVLSFTIWITGLSLIVVIIFVGISIRLCLMLKDPHVKGLLEQKLSTGSLWRPPPLLQGIVIAGIVIAVIGTFSFSTLLEVDGFAVVLSSILFLFVMAIFASPKPEAEPIPKPQAPPKEPPKVQEQYKRDPIPTTPPKKETPGSVYVGEEVE